MKKGTKIWIEDVGFIGEKEVIMVSPQIAMAIDKKGGINPFFYEITDEVDLFKETEITVSDEDSLMGLSPVQWMELNKGLLSDSLKEAICSGIKSFEQWCPASTQPIAALVKDHVAIIGQLIDNRIILSLQVIDANIYSGQVTSVEDSSINKILNIYGFEEIDGERFLLVDPEKVNQLAQKRWIGGWYF